MLKKKKKVGKIVKTDAFGADGVIGKVMLLKPSLLTINFVAL